MKHFTIMLAMFATALATSESDAQAAQKGRPQFAVIVNASNKTADSAAKATVKKLFLKNLSRWPDGTRARPYGRKDSSAEQSAFASAVLGMTNAQIARHWLRVRNMNGTTPPRTVGSDRMVLKHVARHEGAFAVVELDVARKAEGVRVLLKF